MEVTCIIITDHDHNQSLQPCNLTNHKVYTVHTTIVNNPNRKNTQLGEVMVLLMHRKVLFSKRSLSAADMASSVPFLHGQTRPLQSRVVRSSGRAPVVAPCASSRDRPPYQQYMAEHMLKAVEAVHRGELSIRRAAEEYGVPRATLHDKVSGKVGLNVRCGSGRRLLTDEEESCLADFLVGCASIGYAKSRKEVLAIVQQILFSRNATTEVTKGWWESFRKRHPNLTLRHAESLSYARAVASNPDVINRYFDLLEDTMHANGLTHRPTQIFNCDETGMPFTHKPPKVVAGAGQKHPYSVTAGEKSQITILACGSAAGYTIPPMVVFDRKALKPEMTIGEVPGTFYGLSESGWMDSELFEEWLKNHFLQQIPPVRPILLLLDGHSSHYQPGMLRIAAAEGIIIFCLPPHTTHLLQPLDNACFASLKTHWGSACHEFCSQNPGKVVNRYNFSGIFHSAWAQGMAMRNVMASFREVGVYPINRDKVLTQLSGVSATSMHQPSLPFVPFCTPRQQHDATLAQTPQCAPLGIAPASHMPQGSVQIVGPAHPPSTPTGRSHTSSQSAFTSAEVRRFQTRLEEGYTIFLIRGTPSGCPPYNPMSQMRNRKSTLKSTKRYKPGGST